MGGVGVGCGRLCGWGVGGCVRCGWGVGGVWVGYIIEVYVLSYVRS